ncbi:MAG TPA: GIY-YIG nuclease family protein [Chloroflexaceae bacterium]|nr:GIY-YIG nuclease family protein [Chloroflexaceae bacterium]
MSSPDLPHAPGIYKITCLPTEKIYVGSSVDIRSRWLQHHQALTRGKHHSSLLQRAWDKYGPQAFAVTVLELAAPEYLIETEQRWIDGTRCAERAYGYNIYKTAGGPGDVFAQTWEGFIDPNGNEVIIYNLHEFCRKHSLNARAMMALADPGHKLKQHKGWTHRRSPRKREYIKTWEGFIDPAGNEVAAITNLKEFCRKHGLDATHMAAVLKGRICSHKGWTHRDGRKPQDEKTYYGFVNPEGHRVTITNLSAFCEKNGLSKVRMFNLISGVRKRHKGWTWRPLDESETP